MNRFAICLLLLTLTLCGCTASEPTDAELVSLYANNSKVFAELRSMIIVDQQVGRVGDDVIGDSWFKIDNISIDSAAQTAGLSRTRYNEYMRLLGKINAYRISTSGNDDATVHIFRMGSLVEGRTVDIVFENSAPEPIVDDTMSATVNDNTFGYRQLAESWYIRREHD